MNVDEVVNLIALLVVIVSGARLAWFGPLWRKVGLFLVVVGAVVGVIRIVALSQIFGPGQVLINCAIAYVFVTEDVLDMKRNWAEREGRWSR